MWRFKSDRHEAANMILNICLRGNIPIVLLCVRVQCMAFLKGIVLAIKTSRLEDVVGYACSLNASTVPHKLVRDSGLSFQWRCPSNSPHFPALLVGTRAESCVRDISTKECFPSHAMIGYGNSPHYVIAH